MKALRPLNLRLDLGEPSADEDSDQDEPQNHADHTASGYNSRLKGGGGGGGGGAAATTAHDIDIDIDASADVIIGGTYEGNVRPSPSTAPAAADTCRARPQEEEIDEPCTYEVEGIGGRIPRGVSVDLNQARSCDPYLPPRLVSNAALGGRWAFTNGTTRRLTRARGRTVRDPVVTVAAAEATMVSLAHLNGWTYTTTNKLRSRPVASRRCGLPSLVLAGSRVRCVEVRERTTSSFNTTTPRAIAAVVWTT